jgi:predicted metal-dependent phosphoesterase TrpH
VIARAAALRLAAIAITDHDTVSGLAEAEAAAATHNIEFLSGVELSAHLGETEVHIVGLGIDPATSALGSVLDALREERLARARRILEYLKNRGVAIELRNVEAATARGAIGRMHIAREIQAMGLARTVQEAFDKYLCVRRRAFSKNPTVFCLDAIHVIHQARGLAVIAHPGIGMTRKVLPRLLHLPFDGIEAYHVQHSPGHVTEFIQLARDRGWLISGGSDCHGEAKGEPPQLGKVRVPYEHYQAINAALSTSRQP